MSEPFVTCEDALQGAVNELVSAMSALNMEPDPIDPPYGVKQEGPRYLSDSDAWAKHCMEHLHAVFTLLCRAQTEREQLKNKIYKLEIAALEFRKGKHL